MPESDLPNDEVPDDDLDIAAPSKPKRRWGGLVFLLAMAVPICLILWPNKPGDWACVGISSFVGLTSILSAGAVHLLLRYRIGRPSDAVILNPSNRRDHRPTRDIEPAPNVTEKSLGLLGTAVLTGSILLVAWSIWRLDPSIWYYVALLVGVVLLFGGWIGWIRIVQNGALTWMRLAQKPGLLMAKGEPEAAEAACQQALDRAERFAAKDHRRGFMLIFLAMYVMYQGRMAQAKCLFDQSIDILAEHRHRFPVEYFVALNNSAIYFISLRDHNSAQDRMEKALDLTLLCGRAGVFSATPFQLRTIRFLLHMNLAFLLTQIDDLREARHHLEEAKAIFGKLTKAQQTRWHDHFIAICAQWYCAAGRFGDAERELAKAKDAGYVACLRVWSRLQLVRQDYAGAEQSLRQYFLEEQKRGSLHRPDLRDAKLHLAESLIGQAKHAEAISAFREAHAIVADFAMPADNAWRIALATWHQRANDLGRTELAASLAKELAQMSAAPEQAITVLEKFRIHPQRGE